MTDWKDSVVKFRASHGLEAQAPLIGATRRTAVFEVSSPSLIVRLTEVFEQFRICAQDRVIYSGRAVVGNLIETSGTARCEVTLDEKSWSDLVLSELELQSNRLHQQFGDFLREWEKLCLIDREYKVVVADMHSFFTELKLWLDRVQLNVRSAAVGDTAALENQVVSNVAADVLPCIDALFARFEAVARRLMPEVLPVHRSYMRQQLHPLVMCAPFAYRTFVKPLGYAGDYEMVNMIARNRPEGDSLYAKVVNTWFIQQPPAEAHRNRLEYLEQKLVAETLRVNRSRRAAQILNVACGPAHEVRTFIARQPVADNAEMVMLDFNEETLRHLKSAVSEACRSSGRRTRVRYVENSVFQLLKDSSRRRSPNSDQKYDYVYCAGLFDYLSDQVCAQLTSLMYRWLAPGGLLVVTNVEPGNPLRNGMEHLLDWHLIYRDAAQMLKIKPEVVAADDVQVWSDVTGVNVFMEVRKSS